MYRRIGFICCICILVLTVACSLPAEPNNSSGDVTTPGTSPAIAEPPTVVVEKLKSFLQRQFDIPAAQVEVQQAETMQWADACLGLPQADELCAQMVTPGYRVVLSTPDGAFDFHTDQTGQSFRLARSPLN
jgi:hypothetical protein